MKDFTKTQEKKSGALKCNKCSTVVTAFGVKAGDPCAFIHYPGQPQGMKSNSDARSRSGGCGGKYMKIDDQSADNAKRRSDGSA
jgi:hypothetical protein